jgi:hypothetical protein
MYGCEFGAKLQQDRPFALAHCARKECIRNESKFKPAVRAVCLEAKNHANEAEDMINNDWIVHGPKFLLMRV